MAISTPGIGSGLDVNAIVTKLMTVEAQPLDILDKKTAAYQAKLTALGTVSGAIGAFQSSLSGLTSQASFQSTMANSNDTSVLVGAATSKAVAGTYNIAVTQLAQAQTLASGGRTSATAAIGVGTSTTVSFQLGTISGGNFGVAGSALGAGVLTGGISNGALSINGTAIVTDAGTRSAKLLADAINAKNASTGVTATAVPTSTAATLFGGAGAASFGAVDTVGGGTYSLSVGGVQIASQASGVAAGAGVSAASLDAILAGSNGVTDALAAANIGHTGSAAGGDLQFTNAEGANISVTEVVSGAVGGGIGKTSAVANTGSTLTASSSVTLVSATASPITVAGANPAVAGLTKGSGGSYLGAGFAQDGNQASGSIVIDSTNNSLQGIRDAINKGNFGVTATIISDGSATPNHLVLSSTSTGANAAIRISLSGAGGTAPDAALESLLAYDPAGVQNLTQSTSAQSTTLIVNGIPVSSATNTVAAAIPGVTLTIGKIGQANLTVAQDNSAIRKNVDAFIKAYNDLNSAIKNVSGYNPDTKKGGPLLGDALVQRLQNQVRKQMGVAITGLSGDVTSLSQVGISFQKDGNLALDSAKLGKALTNNAGDIAGLFAAVGKVSDPLVSFTSSTSATVPGDYALHITTLASQGSLSSAAVPAASTTIAADTVWTVTINDGTPSVPANTAQVSLRAGSYTPAQLATLLQSAINGVSAFSSKDLAVNASIDSAGKLTVVSSKYGSISNLNIANTSGTAVADIFGSAVPVAGLDVAGTLDGQPADGSGQVLTGKAGSSSEGLKISVTGGATGDRGSVGFSQGYAYQLNNLAATFLGDKGFIAGRTVGIAANITDTGKQRDVFSARLVDIEKRYRAQYTALDTSIASLNSTSSFLTQQFAAMIKSGA